jgi:hypothetical protein
MTRNITESRKTTSFKLSDQVKAILQEKGLSKIFNYEDYKYFKKRIKNAFNDALAIAELFIQYYDDTQSDYHDYIY